MARIAAACIATFRTRSRHRGVIVTAALRSSVGLIAAAAVALSACSTSHPPAAPRSASTDPGRTAATTAQVLEAVKTAQSINDLPDSVGVFLTKADWPMATGRFDCHQVDPHEVDLPANILDPSISEFGQCAAGAEHATKLMVTFGDSRAAMWGAALEDIAVKNGYQLRSFHMANCPPLDLHFVSYEKRVRDNDCYQFRQSAIAAIRNLHPDLVVMTGFSTHILADGSQPTAAQWQKGWESTFRELTQPGTRLVMFGDIPDWEKDDAHCLAGTPLGSPEVQRAEFGGLAVRKSRCRAGRRVGSWGAVHSYAAVGVRGSLRTRHRRYPGVSGPISPHQLLHQVPDRRSR